MNKFNPNDLNKDSKVWGTYIPFRTPSFKAHAKIGQAISALKYRARYTKDYEHKIIPSDHTLWWHNGEEWIEVDFEREYPRHQQGLIFKKT